MQQWGSLKLITKAFYRWAPAMAGPLRIEYDGALYHITSRGNNRGAIFRNDSDRALFLDTLAPQLPCTVA